MNVPDAPSSVSEEPTADFIVEDRVGKLERRYNPATGERWVVAAEAIRQGEEVWALSAAYTPFRDRHSIEIAPGRHQAFTGEMDDYIEHSCVPNLRLDTETETFVALSDIRAGEEVFWNYLTTEWQMEAPFRCKDPQLGRGPCFGLIEGAHILIGEEAQKLSEVAAPWIRERLLRRND